MMTFRERAWAVVLSGTALSLALLASGQRAGAADASVWDGVYTEAQAQRGKGIYDAQCRLCHGEMPVGTSMGPTLSGSDFFANWTGMTVADLFEKIQYTMPANRPGRLREEQVAELVSYILKVNQFPPGKTELPANVDDLRGLLFFAEDPNKQ
jgi:S-disulfanyl-L-cysteine oxidoreductase SoxD